MTNSDRLRESADRLIRIARDPEAVARLSDQDKRDMLLMMEVLPKHIEGPLLHRVFPDEGPLRRELYPKHTEHFAAGKDYKARAFMAANRVGKTWAGGYETACHSTGWYPAWWEGWRIDRPGEYLVAAKTTTTLKKVPQKTLFGTAYRDEKGKFRVKGDGMIPGQKIRHETAIFMPAAPGTLKEIGVQYRDSETEWSTISMLSYEMGRGVFEGTAYDLAWLDEECGMDIYVETAKRLMTTGGRMVLTWTPLDGITEVVMAFLGDEYLPPKVDAFDVDSLVADTSEEMGVVSYRS